MGITEWVQMARLFQLVRCLVRVYPHAFSHQHKTACILFHNPPASLPERSLPPDMSWMSELWGSNGIISPSLDPITLECDYQAHTPQSSGRPATEHPRSRRLERNDRRLRPKRAAALDRYHRSGLPVSPNAAPMIVYHDVALPFAPRTERRIAGYNARWQRDEALTLVRKTFDARRGHG